ncbi:MAG: hypothetical protein AAF202_08270 [Pseudomonadota bacterium]
MLLRILLSLALLGFASTALGQGETVGQKPEAEQKTDKIVNLRIAPIQALIGVAMGNIMVNVHDRVNVGLSGAFLFNQEPLRNAVSNSSDSTSDADDFDFAYNEVGARVDVGLSNSIMANTWYLSGVLRNLNIEVEDRLSDGKATGDIVVAGAILGYQWTLDSFNLSLGGGFNSAISERYDTENVADVSDDDFESIGTTATIDLNMGFTF